MEIQIPLHLKKYFEELHARHGIELTDGQKKWYTHQYNILGETIKQEFPSTPEEAFLGSDDALFYARELNQIKESGQITDVRYNRTLPVYCAFDIGYRDATSIWFFQILPSKDIHIIDFYENSKEDISHYVQVLNQKGYVYDKLFLPHDAQNHNVAGGTSVEEQLVRFGFRCQVLTRGQWNNSTFIQQIQQCRNLILRCWFDKERCSHGIKALGSYRKKWNESLSMYSTDPLHDWASHAADAFKYLVQAIQNMDNVPSKDSLKEEIQKVKARRRMMV